MMVKQWNNRIKNINSYLPWMKPNVRAFTEEDLINKVSTTPRSRSNSQTRSSDSDVYE